MQAIITLPALQRWCQMDTYYVPMSNFMGLSRNEEAAVVSDSTLARASEHMIRHTAAVFSVLFF